MDRVNPAVLPPYLLVFAVVGLASAKVSCDSGCLIADQANVLDTRDGLYLVYRVTGFQDKAEFFEAYQGKPEFDSCGSTRKPALATAFYERKEGLLKKVELHGNRLEIIYTHDVSESIEPSKARLSQ
jgi:hypothetical protein